MKQPAIAYFSMEIGLESSIPTYAGGLGVLAGDTLRAAADLGFPLVGISLAHRHGYLRQHLGPDGWQQESPAPWSPESLLEEMPARARIEIEGRTVVVRAWRYSIRGPSGFEVPVYLLDTDLAENAPEDRALSERLYGGDRLHRLCQEVVLGLGGVAMLEALGYDDVRAYHMNEGHSALLTLALLDRQQEAGQKAIEAVRERCVFTTHTPVPAGHDQFPMELAARVLGPETAERLAGIGCCLEGVLNLTYLALFFSHYVNGVAMRHGQISRDMFPGYPIASITNGVHGVTWTAPAFQELFDRHIPNWRLQNDDLRYAIGIPVQEIRQAHDRSKAELLAEVERRSGKRFPVDRLTLGFARRATPYKRADLLLSDADRLRRIARTGALQILYAGKAHPQDEAGKQMIRRVIDAVRVLEGNVEVVYLENHDMELGRLLCAGVDLWVNTPQKPQEASGTSGMKAAMNGVPSLSILDGWWIEGHVEGVTGWSIGDSWEIELTPGREGALLYEKLEEVVATFYGRPETWGRIMRHAISLNGSFFNAHRMLGQYATSAYHLQSWLHSPR